MKVLAQSEWGVRAGAASVGADDIIGDGVARRRGRWAGRAVLPLLAALGCAQPGGRPDAPPTAAAAASEVTVSVVGTSDLHGYLESRPVKVTDRGGVVQTISRGGLALFGGYLANLRQRHPVLLLDAGDLFQGTLVSNLGEGQAVIAGYNALGYDGAAIGNHEFDYGPAGALTVPLTAADDPTGALKARIAEAKFPFLSANILDKKTGQAVAWPNTYPFRKLSIGGVPIGVIGAVTEDTPRTTNLLNLRDVTIGPIVPAVRAAAAALRQQGVAAVVLTVHEGANCASFKDPRDPSGCKNNDERVLGLVQRLEGAVDAVVGGHSHAGVAHFVGEVPVVQSFAMGQAFGRIDLVFRRVPTGPEAPSGFVLDKTRTQIHPPTELCSVALPEADAQPIAAPGADATTGADNAAAAMPAGTSVTTRPLWRCEAKALNGTTLQPARYEGQPVVLSAAVEAALAPHIEKAAARRASLIGVTLPVRLRRSYRAESPLGVLLADLIRSGAARATGEPVDFAFQNGGGIRNELPAGPLQYGHLFEVLPFDNRLALVRMTGANLTDLYERNLQGSHGILVPSGMTVEASCAGPKLVVTLRGLDGKPLEPARTYTVAVSDFLASGGDNFSAILPALPPGSVRYFDSLMLRELSLTELQGYRGPLLSGQEGAAPPRLRLSAPRPMKCP